MKRETIDGAEAGIDSLMTEKFGVRSGGLRDKLRRVSRKLPRGAKSVLAEDLDYLEKARKRTSHPRRRGQIDQKRLAHMVASHEKRLEKVNPSEDRTRAMINWLGILVINLMIFAVVYYALLKWLGAI